MLNINLPQEISYRHYELEDISSGSVGSDSLSIPVQFISWLSVYLPGIPVCSTNTCQFHCKITSLYNDFLELGKHMTYKLSFHDDNCQVSEKLCQAADLKLPQSVLTNNICMLHKLYTSQAKS